MGYIKIESTNPNLSYVISKNPSSPMSVKSLRNGSSFGWFTNENQYNLYFQDADDEISYSKGYEKEFEYNTIEKYVSSEMYNNLISNYFSIKIDNEYDKLGFENKLFINLIYLNNDRFLKLFNKFFDDKFKIEVNELLKRTYSLTITTKEKIYDLIAYTQLFLMFCNTDDNSYYIDKEAVNKYVDLCNYFDVPYYVRYVFKTKIIKDRNLFDSFQKSLETSKRHKIKLVNGDTQNSRKNFVSNHIDFNKPIVDIGCGEGFYTTLANRLGDNEYYAIDVDEDELEKVKKRISRKKIENITTLSSLEDYIENKYEQQEVNVLLVEVVEHMKKDKAIELVSKVLEQVNFSSFIITTPNYTFNKYYELETKYRHHDHDIEYTVYDFLELVKSVLDENKFTFTHYGIGDVVDGEPCTQSVVIKNK